MTEAPGWFSKAIAVEPERMGIEVAGVSIETLAWGERGKPGLLFLHGNGAHAEWWRFFAPFFARDWRVGALSWSGMGRSGWRDRYSMDIHGEEMLTCAEALGVFEGEQLPHVVAHSFGSAVALRVAASEAGERLGQLVVVDNTAWPANGMAHLVADRRPWTNPGYATLAEGAARFRLRPEQRCDNDYILDFIGRHSLQLRADGRWHWAFDPDADIKRGNSHLEDSSRIVAAARCPLSFLFGDRSALVTPDLLDLTRNSAPAGTSFVEMPDAGHHLMLDQPLGFVAAVRTLLA